MNSIKIPKKWGSVFGDKLKTALKDKLVKETQYRLGSERTIQHNVPDIMGKVRRESNYTNRPSILAGLSRISSVLRDSINARMSK